MNNQHMFKPTGKMVPVPKNTFMNAVYSELENFKTKLLNGDSDPVPNPFYESLVVTINNTVVMIPSDIQNEAIASYIQTNPQLKHMTENIITDPIRSPLIDSGAFNPHRNNDADVDAYIIDEDNTKLPQTGGNGIYILICIVVLGLLMFLYKEKLKLI